MIIPSPILKYYILDLSPHNSLVKYLVDQGHTVFMLSWRNPDARDRELGVDHYLRLGIRAAIDAAAAITRQKIHAVGYCLGGTFLTAARGLDGERIGDDRLASLTLLATEVDFTEAGELSIFIDDSQLAYLEDLTWEQGYLDGKQMSGAFTLLNSNDLIWSRVVRQYLMAEPQKVTDLSAWNVDTTRLPHRMHTEYLRNLYLNNDLASGRMRYDGRIDRAVRHTRADLPRRNRARSRRAVEVRLHAEPVCRRRCHVLPHQRWPQRRHRQSDPTSKHRHGTTGLRQRRRPTATSTRTSGLRAMHRSMARGGRPGKRGSCERSGKPGKPPHDGQCRLRGDGRRAGNVRADEVTRRASPLPGSAGNERLGPQR